MPRFFRKSRRGGFRSKKKVPKATKRYVKRVLDRQVEDKYFQGTGSLSIANSDATVGTSVHLTSMIPGTGVSDRIGQKIRIKSIKFNMSIRTQGDPAAFNPLNPFTTGEIRYALTQFKEQTGRVLVSTPNDSAFTSSAANSIWNNGSANVIIANQRLFTGYQAMRVLKQGTRQIQVLGGGTNNPAATQVSILKRFKRPLMVQFTGTTATAGSVLKNGLWFNIMGAHVADVSVSFVGAYGYTVTYEDA